jgi:membrane protease YdiL (CAAX protease family)
LVADSAATAPSPTTLPQADPVIQGRIGLVVLALSAVAIVLTIRLRVYRPSLVVGPSRRPPGERLWVLLLAALIGFCAWQLVSGAYLAHLMIQWKQAGIEDAARHAQDLLSPADMAFLSTIPPIAGFLVMLACNAIFAPGTLFAIGLSPRRLAVGVGTGIIAFLVIGPLLEWSLIALEAYYRHVHYQHPTEHALLKSLGQTRDQRYEVLLIVAATLVAPFLEELLFRGHLQTFLRELFASASARAREPLAAAAIAFPAAVPPGSSFGLTPPPPPPSAPPLPLAPPLPWALTGAAAPIPRVQPAARPWHAWLAILITSLLFALMHERWMQPAIFLLSVGLGYTYERTGNLWSSITVHLLFNTANTLQFLLLFHGH